LKCYSVANANAVLELGKFESEFPLQEKINFLSVLRQLRTKCGYKNVSAKKEAGMIVF
jgi:hypothetical protein